MCGYDQIFLAGDAPGIGESRGPRLKRSGECKGPPTCQGEGESPKTEIV